MQKRPAMWLGAAVAALGIASCSSNNAAISGLSSSTTTRSGPSQNVSADKALAVAANLKLSDFPDGWTATPQSNQNAGTQGIDTRLASCLHTSISIFNEKSPTQASSPNFDDSNGDEASSGVDYLVTAASAQAEIATLQSPRFPSCFTTAVNALLQYELNNPSSTGSTLPAGVSFGQATVRRADVIPIVW